jgi:hypothetical protein
MRPFADFLRIINQDEVVEVRRARFLKKSETPLGNPGRSGAIGAIPPKKI